MRPHDAAGRSFAGWPANASSWKAIAFFEAHEIREESGHGNRAAFLGAYLLEHRFFAGSALLLRIEQGYEVRRPSLVMLRARMAGRSREVSVGGHVIPTVEGELL